VGRPLLLACPSLRDHLPGEGAEDDVGKNAIGYWLFAFGQQPFAYFGRQSPDIYRRRRWLAVGSWLLVC
jgi:hypothetical protein